MEEIQVIPPRMYQGPRQEKQFRKQRQLLQRQQIVDSPDNQETSLVLIQRPTLTLPVPRVVVPAPVARSNIPLKACAYGLGVVGLSLNAWFAWNQGTALIDKVILSSEGFVAEAVMFFLLTQATAFWIQRRWGRFLASVVVWPFLFVFALTNSLGFASLNLSEASTARAERITPAVSDAQRRLDAITASKTTECLKRGDKCRQLDKDEQLAFQSLTDAREKVSAIADPQTASTAKLVAWVTLGRLHPSADDIVMLRLLFLTILPQLGGLVLMLSSRN